MENPIAISKINDFVFCPMSIYYHSIYENYDESVYHRSPQKIGKIKHENIETKKYVTSKHIFQGIPIYSGKYNLFGKIDIYDSKKFELIERKYKVDTIYDGYRYQLYAQMYCLEEMGYRVDKLFIYSLSDNKRYEISKPNKEENRNFLKILESMMNYDFSGLIINLNKCTNCIYSELCGEIC